MPIAVRVESVSKQYRIYDRPADRLKETLTRGRWKAVGSPGTELEFAL